MKGDGCQVITLFYIHTMKWYPFWKVWYFTREQRLGLGLLVLLIFLVTILREPLSDYFYKTKERQLTERNQDVWNQLSAQIDSAKSQNHPVAKNEDSNLVASIATPKKDNPSVSNLIIDINQSSASDFKQLKGIGDVLSERIVKYRSKLGGFYTKEQLKEVYGISDTLYLNINRQLKVNAARISKINLNQTDLSTLQSHPYISKTLAKQIVGYREKVKKFDSVEDIKKMYAMNDSIYNKLYPYLTIY